jgi:hypothetical protein
MKHQNHFQKDLPRGLSNHSCLAGKFAWQIESSAMARGVRDAGRFFESFSLTGT